MKIANIKLDTLSNNDFFELYSAVLAEDRKRKNQAKDNAIREIKNCLSKIEYLMDMHDLSFTALHQINEDEKFYPNDFTIFN